jgi:hypothetical protein
MEEIDGPFDGIEILASVRLLTVLIVVEAFNIVTVLVEFPLAHIGIEHTGILIRI